MVIRFSLLCISTTSRLYIGLAVCLQYFTIFSLMCSNLYISAGCRERPDQESDWLTDGLFYACTSRILWSMNLLMNEYCQYCHLKNCTICAHFVWLTSVTERVSWEVQVQPSPRHSAQGFQVTTIWITKRFFRFAIAFTRQMTSHTRLLLPRQFRHL